MDTPVVSVVISSYNQGRYIGACIDSILCQTAHTEPEIVVVDDASTDDTAEIVRDIRAPGLQFIPHERNTGLVSTLNDGFARAHGKYIARIDADDRYRPDFFAKTLEILEESPRVDLVYGDVAAIDEHGNTLADPWNGIRSREAHNGEMHRGNELLALIEENFIPAPTVIARRNAWASALPVPNWVFRSFPSTDWYLNLRMARVHEFCYLPESLAEYRLHSWNWHRKIGADPRVEATVIRILDEIFSEQDHDDGKRRIRSRTYAGAYLRFAPLYLAAGNSSDARRCYRAAIRYRPGCLRSPRVLRGVLAASLGREGSQTLKRVFKR